MFFVFLLPCCNSFCFEGQLPSLQKLSQPLPLLLLLPPPHSKVHPHPRPVTSSNNNEPTFALPKIQHKKKLWRKVHFAWEMLHFFFFWENSASPPFCFVLGSRKVLLFLSSHIFLFSSFFCKSALNHARRGGGGKDDVCKSSTNSIFPI